MKSENLPAMYIDTVSGSMDYVHQAKENIEPGRMRLYTEQGKLDYAGKIESIKIRGNNLSAPKKPYSLKLSIDGDLLGMGQAEKWILLANYFDPTHMRNKIVFDFAEDFGLQYSPKSRWMDVYLNGEYAGLYLLCERNEVHLQRVDVKKDSFLVSTELEERLINQNLPYVVTKKGVAIRIHDTTLDADGLAEKIQSAEDAIYAENGIDPFTGKHWTELIDLDSWMRKYLIEEVFGNVDGGRLSQFFYFDGTEKKIYAGPVWDYDMAMANPNIFREAVPEMFYVNCPAAYDGSAWFYALYQNDMFYSNMVELYKTEFLPLMTKLLNGGITEYMRKINRSACLDQLRWKTEPARENVEKIQTYLKERIVFLNSIWIENQKYAAVHGMSYYRYVTYAVPIGGYLPPLVEEENFQWYITETETLLDVTKPIFEDMYIEQRFVGDPLSGRREYWEVKCALIRKVRCGPFLAHSVTNCPRYIS